jgi:predicted RNA binding protein YcfA (HicA-like mRNA interferase family)
LAERHDLAPVVESADAEPRMPTMARVTPRFMAPCSMRRSLRKSFLTYSFMRQYVRMKPETNRAKVVARLRREGWQNVGGAHHDKFRHPARGEPIIVPRRKTLSPGVARAIAKAAGWLD